MLWRWLWRRRVLCCDIRSRPRSTAFCHTFYFLRFNNWRVLSFGFLIQLHGSCSRTYCLFHELTVNVVKLNIGDIWDLLYVMNRLVIRPWADDPLEILYEILLLRRLLLNSQFKLCTSTQKCSLRLRYLSWQVCPTSCSFFESFFKNLSGWLVSYSLSSEF